jgi:histone chaperone ASF1
LESRGSCVFHIDLEWKLIYVGSADSESFDQELDTCMVGPVPVGINSFEFEAAAPLPSRIPSSDLIGVTVILLTCSYNDHEFVRVGYYVNTEYEEGELKDAFDKANLVADATAAEVDDDEQDDEDEDNENENENENEVEEEPVKRQEIERKEEKPVVEISIVKAPDPTKHVDKLVRSVLGEKPRVTRFNIKW